MARLPAKTMQLRIDGEDQPFLVIPLSADRDACCAVEECKCSPREVSGFAPEH